ncbi:MAG: hypothetical protein H6509_14100 [Bryobacterales bacterium]|nr:hypothetical protein [Acidobacteriota bacterium]MCB9385744.1 hypothetical protein [Bryobacterales bacterium]
MSKAAIVSILFLLAFVGLVVYSTMDLRQETCEVCMTFNGQTQCATASGTTREEAQRTATDTACAPISGGMTESIQCSNTAPDSVTWF